MKHTKEVPPQLDPLKREHVHPQEAPKTAAVQQATAPASTATPAPVKNEKAAK